MIQIFSVLIGGFFGAAFRRMFQTLFNKLLLSRPILFSILVLHLIGCFGLGWFFPRKEEWELSLQLMVSMGFFGAFTTFSTFSMEALDLMKKHRYIECLIYITVSVIGGILAFLFGYML